MKTSLVIFLRGYNDNIKTNLWFHYARSLLLIKKKKVILDHYNQPFSSNNIFTIAQRIYFAVVREMFLCTATCDKSFGQ